ncbi:MAG TPA: M1 family metallopeptidase [Thermoanaerobaculia bacterium]|nr:M1 family metallopeptidase [Thermoanaerobaculia bacterium]
MRAVLWVVAAVFAVAAAAQNPSVDVLHYRIELTLPASGAEIAATTELSVRPLTTPLTTLALDFAGLTIDEITVDGVKADYTRDGERLSIKTSKSEPFRAAIRYHGTPSDGLYIRGNKYGDHGAFADNWPNRAHYWFPAVDHPSDKATVEFIVTAPSTYDVIANGTRVETIALPNAQRRTRWSEATPIPVHCMVVGATEFAIVRAGDGVEYWLYPKDRDAGVKELGRAPEMVAFFTELIGPYPYAKLAIVESSTRFGGMENASAIFLDEKRIDGEGSLERLVAHEIAHQWFGDSVSQRAWHDLWLSEGFATYFGHLYFERADGREALVERMRGDRDEYLRVWAEDPRPVYDPRIVDLTRLLNAYNYRKGGWVLHMLRGVMGDTAFFAGIRDYFSAYRERNASTAEFRMVMERHAGQSLEWFFRQWIYEPGHPVFDTKWTWNDAKVRVQVDQKQAGNVFRTPAVIEVRDGSGGASRHNVVIDERNEAFEWPSETKPADVVLDPDGWVLKE